MASKEVPQPKPEINPNSAYSEALQSSAGALPEAIMQQLRAQPHPNAYSRRVSSSSLPPPEPAANPYADILENRPAIEAGKVLASIKLKTGFREEPTSRRMKVAQDIIGVVRRLRSGELETYEDKLRKEEDKGHTEAAAYGEAKIGESEFVEVATHWDFFVGSFGVVVGEKITRATELAVREKLPLVGIFSSGGARQQENFPALVQMPRIIDVLNEFKQKAKRPYVAYLLHQVWGGLSASAVPVADIIVAQRGTDYGFAGGRVIESFTYQPVPKGAQSVEVASRNRIVDVIVKDEVEFVDWLGRFLKMENAIVKMRGRKPSKTLLDLPPIVPSRQERFSFEQMGFALPSLQHQGDIVSQDVNMSGKEIVVKQEEKSLGEKLYKEYLSFIRDSGRLDTEFLLVHCFDDVVPLYSREVHEDMIRNPAIIAALGKLGEQPFLVVGNQPSYQKNMEGVINRIPSTPAPEDFLYLQRMLAFGERLGYPIIFVTDTLGAKPTLDAEFTDQSRKIAETIYSAISYKNVALSIVLGSLGSGGGMVTTPIVDHNVMDQGAHAYVSEPVSATTILNSKTNPEREEVIETIGSLRVTAQDQFDLGLMDGIIPPVEKGPDEIFKRAQVIRDYLGRVAFELLGQSNKKRLESRKLKIRNLRGIPLAE